MNQELKDLVIKEADNIKKFATKEEIGKLNFETLDPTHLKLCIYGQMTGDCDSDRARYLLNKCTKPYSMDIEKDSPRSNSKYFPNTHKRFSFSPIEYAISNHPKHNNQLIKYLKGEVETIFE